MDDDLAPGIETAPLVLARKPCDTCSSVAIEAPAPTARAREPVVSAPSPCRCAPETALRPLPIALATSSPERRQKLLARGIAETLEDSKELARRLRVAREQRAAQPPRRARRVPLTLEQSKAFALQHNARTDTNIAQSLEESRALAERWRQYTAGSGAATLEEAFALAARLKEPPRASAPIRHAPRAAAGTSMLPRTLEESLAFAERHNARADTNIAQTLDESKQLAERWRAWTVGSGAATLEEAKALAERLRPGATLRKPGPTIVARSGAGAGTKPVLPTVPLTFQNALWTRFDPPAGIRITDIAAGAATVTSPGGLLRRRVVWATGVEATGARTFVYRVSADGSFDEQFNVLAAEPALPVQVVAARDTAQPFVFRRDSPVWTRSTSANDWQLLWSYAGIVDLAVGRLADTSAPEIWWVDDAGFLYQVELSGSGPGTASTSTLRASNIARVSLAMDGTLWTVDRDGRVLRGTTFEAMSADGFATDVAAAPGGDVYAIGTKRAKDAVTSSGTIPATGYEIWWWNHFTKSWTKVDPGWGVAIDVDDDGTLWVVDENGSVLNRGGRSWGFWELSTRSRPNGEGWCAFEQDFLDAAKTAPFGAPLTDPADISSKILHHALPTVLQEAVDRFVEAGATTLRVAQSLATYDGAQWQPLGYDIWEPFQILLAATLGADVFVLFDVVRTAKKIVPQAQQGMTFDDTAMIEWFNKQFDNFRVGVEKLFSEAGLSQRFEDVVKYVSIGGEVDVFFEIPLGDWSKWKKFYYQVAAHIHLTVPRVKVGCALSLFGAPGTTGAWGIFDKATSPDNNWPVLLNAASDYAGFTSYPDIGEMLDHPEDASDEFSVPHRFEKMVNIAGDLPVVLEEYGYPTYDNATKSRLEQAWPGRSPPFPQSFYAEDGWAGQRAAIDLTFQIWDDKKLQVPLLVWFTLFEEHVEGVGCNPIGTPVENPTYYGNVCSPCNDSNCLHPCGIGEGQNTLGLNPLKPPTETQLQDEERAGRFFGSSGLIQSNGVPKSDPVVPAPWDAMIEQTSARRVPRGGS